MGPESVAFRFTEAALCFGGRQCTLTDVAIAAGVAPANIAKTPKALNSISPSTVYSAMREIRRLLESAIDNMKVSKLHGVSVTHFSTKRSFWKVQYEYSAVSSAEMLDKEGIGIYSLDWTTELTF